MTVKNTEKQLKETQETIRILQEELNETNRGLVALSMELEERVEARTEQLKKSNEKLKEEINRRKEVEEKSRRKMFDLGERIKEMKGLYDVTRTLADHRKSLDEILTEIMRFIPEAWQYPAITCSRITFEKKEYKTENFKETPWKQSAGILAFGKKTGLLEIYYLEEKPVLYEGPFLKEERELIDSIAMQIGKFIERYRTDRALKESEKKFRTLVENIKLGVYRSTGPGGKLLEVNPGFARLFGYKNKDELLKINLKEIYGNPKDREKFNEEMLKNGFVKNLEIVFKRKDGKTFIGSETAVVVRDEEGNVNYYDGIVEDITERKEAEEALKESEEKFRNLSEQSPNMIFINRKGKIVYANKKCEELTGYSREEFYSPDFDYLELIEPEHRELVLKSFQKHMNGEDVEPVEYTLRTKNGVKIDAILTTKLIKSGGEEAILGIITDITEQKNAEKQLMQLNRELTRSNEELQQFAHVASHDLQEPLRMVASYVQLLERRYKGKLDEDADEFIGYAVDGAKRMQNLINNLLLYSRVGIRGKPFKREDMNVLLNKALENLKITIEENDAEITYDKLPVVECDELQMVQVFQNLIGNSIKFRTEDKPKIHISAEKNDKSWLFSVRDNGIGIESRYRDRIFIIFQSLHSKKEYPGSGIGLTISKKIIERHGGSMWFSSKPEQGTTFYFSIPVRGGVNNNVQISKTEACGNSSH